MARPVIGIQMEREAPNQSLKYQAEKKLQYAPLDGNLLLVTLM